MLAYRIPDVAPAHAADRMRAGDHPGLARIALAGPWQFSAHPEGGSLATWLGSRVPRIDDLCDAVSCSDGLTYYRPSPLPSPMDLAKTLHSSDEIDVDLVSGVRVSILLARSSPRRLRFTGDSSIGEPLTEYGRLARVVSERLAEADADHPITTDDADVRRLLLLAIAQRYRVTEELLDDVGWISTADVDPVICAIMGSDPKAFAAATGI